MIKTKYSRDYLGETNKYVKIKKPKGKSPYTDNLENWKDFDIFKKKWDALSPKENTLIKKPEDLYGLDDSAYNSEYVKRVREQEELLDEIANELINLNDNSADEKEVYYQFVAFWRVMDRHFCMSNNPVAMDQMLGLTDYLFKKDWTKMDSEGLDALEPFYKTMPQSFIKAAKYGMPFDVQDALKLLDMMTDMYVIMFDFYYCHRNTTYIPDDLYALQDMLLWDYDYLVKHKVYLPGDLQIRFKEKVYDYDLADNKE